MLIPNMSTIPMHAREVKRLAIASIAEIEVERTKRMQEAYEEVKDDMCSHMFGLWKHKMYPSKEIAYEYAPEVLREARYALTDQNTCELLKRAAEYVLDDVDVVDKTMYISLHDYRALT